MWKIEILTNFFLLRHSQINILLSNFNNCNNKNLWKFPRKENNCFIHFLIEIKIKFGIRFYKKELKSLLGSKRIQFDLVNAKLQIFVQMTQNGMKIFHFIWRTKSNVMYLPAKRIRNERPIWSMLRFDFVYLNMCCTCVALLLYFSSLFFLFFFFFCSFFCLFDVCIEIPIPYRQCNSHRSRCILFRKRGVCCMLNLQIRIGRVFIFTHSRPLWCMMRMICFRLVCNFEHWAIAIFGESLLFMENR